MKREPEVYDFSAQPRVAGPKPKYREEYLLATTQTLGNGKPHERSSSGARKHLRSSGLYEVRVQTIAAHYEAEKVREEIDKAYIPQRTLRFNLEIRVRLWVRTHDSTSSRQP